MQQRITRYLLSLARAFSVGLIVTALSLSVGLADDKATPATLDAKSMATHKQSMTIQPKFGGESIQLNTFCLDRAGNILACVGGDTVSFQAKEDGTYEAVKKQSPKALQAYSPDGELLWQVELSFKPTAINLAKNGQIFVAGSGKVARLDTNGKILTLVDSPNLGDLDSLRERVQEAAKKQKADIMGSFTEQLDRVNERIAKIEAKPEDERSDREKKQITAFLKQRKTYEEQLAQMEAMYADMFNVDSMVEQKTNITSIAVNSQDVFVCCTAMEGFGYEVWRLNHDLESPEKVVATLGGCCGQCDIQATDEHLVIADNTKFQVTLMDRDGKEVSGFGKRDGEAADGFGSCCNPMNVRCCDNGDILTAESSIGWIKRFNAAGELLGVIGKAGIGGGCKHVAIGFDAERNRYYMMNVDKSLICVLVPKAEAPEFTEEELAAKAAREGLGQKLIGTWELSTGAKPKSDSDAKANGEQAGEAAAQAVVILQTNTNEKSQDETQDEEAADDAALLSAPVQMTMPKSLEFHENGKLVMTESQLFGSAGMKWEAVRQDGKKLIVSQIMDGVASYEFIIEFKSDEEATMTMAYDGNPMMPAQIYRRVATANQAPESEKSDK